MAGGAKSARGPDRRGAICFGRREIAFEDRGRNDYQASHDLEDLLAVVDGHPEIVDEMQAADQQLATYVATTLRRMLADPSFVDALPGHLAPDAASQSRVDLLIDRLGQLAGHKP